MNKQQRLAKKTEDLLDKSQQARFAQLRSLEKLLFTRLMEELRGMLEETNGRIVSRVGFVTVSKAVDRIFDLVTGSGLGAISRDVASDMQQVLNFNANYYRVLAVNQDAKYGDIKQTVDSLMKRRLGIDKDGRIRRKSYLDQIFQTQASRDEVKQLVQKSISAGVPMSKLRKALLNKVTGTPGKQGAAGTLENHIGTFLYDTYSVYDRAINNEWGGRLNLQFGIYTGGLIETSREFCRKRNGKVFTSEEANAEWPNDPTLPKSSAEKKAGGPPADYVPLEDLGRWNCRHRFLYISAAEAYRRRPDLKPAKA